jgi:peptidyl-prolyl cis-trans isomerase D
VAAMKSKTSKFFAWIIVSLLVLGLAGFGIQDVINSAGRQDVASFANQSISPKAYIRAIQQDINNFSQRFGSQLTFNQASSLGIPQRALQNLITLALIDQSASELKISRGDSTLLETIEKNSNFHDFSGKFNRENYEYVLQNSNLLPEEYEEILRKELTRKIILSISKSQVLIGDTTINALINFVKEERYVDIIQLSEKNMKYQPLEPTKKEITDYFNENNDVFMQPETKKISYLLLTPDMVEPSVELSENEIKSLFLDRKLDYYTPEQRNVDRLTFLDKNSATNAMTKIKSKPEYFDQILLDRNLTSDDIAMGLIKPTDLSDNVSNFLFSFSEIGTYGPFKTDLGYNLFRINEIKPEINQSFSEVRDSIEKEILKEKSIEKINSLISVLQDDLAGGATMEELTNSTPLEIGTLEVYNGANLPLFAQSQIFQDAIDTASTYESEILTLEDGSIFSLRLDSEQEPYLKDMNTVTEELKNMVRKEKIKSALQKEANDLISLVKPNNRISQLNESSQYKINKDEMYTRFSQGTEIPNKILEEIFILDEDVITSIAEQDTVFIVQLLKRELPLIKSAENSDLKKKFTQQFDVSINQDIVSSLIEGLNSPEKVKINQKTIDRINLSFE